MLIKHARQFPKHIQFAISYMSAHKKKYILLRCQLQQHGQLDLLSEYETLNSRNGGKLFNRSNIKRSHLGTYLISRFHTLVF